MIIITINVIILKSDKEIFKSYISFLGDVFGSGLYKVQATNQKNILCIFIYTCIDRYLYTCIEDCIGIFSINRYNVLIVKTCIDDYPTV